MKDSIALAGSKNNSIFWSMMLNLDEFNTHIIETETPEEILAELQNLQGSPQALLISVDYPAQSVVPVLRELAATADINVIAVTTGSNYDLEVAVRTAGIFYYLTLPNEMDRMSRVVECALGENSTHNQGKPYV